ncbi:MAG TPA: hypothetical protein VJA40_05535 [archaeon]|nr:hypothetical protein [archaeon]
MKPFNALAFLLAVASLTAMAGASVLTFTQIAVEVQESGDASVTETFTFSFVSPFEKNEFVKSLAQYGIDSEAWQGYHANIKPHVGFPAIDDSITNKRLSAKAVEAVGPGVVEHGVVELKYDVESFASQLSSGQIGETEWELTPNVFNFPVEKGLVKLEADEQILVLAPRRSEFFDVNPPAEVKGTQLTWKGEFSTNSWTMKYKLRRLPVPSYLFNLQLPALDNTAKVALTLALLVVGTALFYNRDYLKPRIRDYLITHSSAKRPVFDKRPEDVRLE